MLRALDHPQAGCPSRLSDWRGQDREGEDGRLQIKTRLHVAGASITHRLPGHLG